MNEIRIAPLRGQALKPYLEELGKLRLGVFREYPYLYDGTLEDERDYLKTYVTAATSLVALAQDGDKPVGATTCLRMDEADAGFRACFEKAGYDTSSICYLGESVLQKPYRGRGIGKQFCKIREDHARRLDCTVTAFCAVDRDEKHPLRPADYQPLDGFWQAQGYVRQPSLQAAFAWKEVHEANESLKTLTFWIKKLA